MQEILLLCVKIGILLRSWYGSTDYYGTFEAFHSSGSEAFYHSGLDAFINSFEYLIICFRTS